MAGQKMPDEGSGQTFDQLGFFIAAKMSEDDGFFALKLAPAGACRAAVKQPSLPSARLQAALGLRPRRALSSAEATNETIIHPLAGKGAQALFHF